MEHALPFNEKLYELLLKKPIKAWTIEQLSNHFDCGVQKIIDGIATLKDEGKNFIVHNKTIELSKEIKKAAPLVIDQRHLSGKEVKFGFVTDNHLGSKYERLDVLNALYDIFKKEGIDTVYNAGNMIDGEKRFNRYDIHKHGAEEQVNYLIEVYPNIKGIKTYFITGDDHEGWYTQDFGIDIGRLIVNRASENGRSDLVYLGHMEHDVILKARRGEAILRIQHPGGGSAYAISYTTQKLIESLSPGEKPQILLIGHYHKAEMLYYRGVYAIQGGCTMDQSPFMRKKRIAAHVGGWIISFQQATHGAIARLKAEWIPFYDKTFYERPWKYQW